MTAHMGSAVAVFAQPPTEPVEWPAEVWSTIDTALSWLLWCSIVACIVALMVCGAVLVNQRKSTGTQVIEDATVARIMLCAAVIGSASGIAQAVLA